jgi:Ca2+-binding EF-hand superfamily protein
MELEQTIFNNWDTDMDGYISKEEQGVYSSQIMKVDLDGDGKISKHEFDVDINNL